MAEQINQTRRSDRTPPSPAYRLSTAKDE